MKNVRWSVRFVNEITVANDRQHFDFPGNRKTSEMFVRNYRMINDTLIEIRRGLYEKFRR